MKNFRGRKKQARFQTKKFKGDKPDPTKPQEPPYKLRNPKPRPALNIPRPEKSPPLKRFPDKVIIITDKNYANICGKIADAFNSNGIDTTFINARKSKMTDPDIVNTFKGDHSKMLALYYDPGDTKGTIRYFTRNINAPSDMPWGLIRGSSYYRVDNLAMEGSVEKLPGRTFSTQIVKKKNGRIYRKMSREITHKKRVPYNIAGIKTMNTFFDSLTPLVLVGTECLLTKNPRSMFLGQPQIFDRDFKDDKPLKKVGHITSSSPINNLKKGTHKIRESFKNINFVKTEIIGKPPVEHAKCLSFLDNIGISVLTMTDFDSGLGYTGLESLSRSCLCISKNSVNAHMINSPIVNAGNQKELVTKIKYFHDNPKEYDRIRKQQYDWGKKNFSYEAIADRFRKIIEHTIKINWAVNENNPFRKI